ncbi:hypothetical protein ABKN59_007972 [Abortiporus biennis]
MPTTCAGIPIQGSSWATSYNDHRDYTFVRRSLPTRSPNADDPSSQQTASTWIILGVVLIIVLILSALGFISARHHLMKKHQDDVAFGDIDTSYNTSTNQSDLEVLYSGDKVKQTTGVLRKPVLWELYADIREEKKVLDGRQEMGDNHWDSFLPVGVHVSKPIRSIISIEPSSPSLSSPIHSAESDIQVAVTIAMPVNPDLSSPSKRNPHGTMPDYAIGIVKTPSSCKTSSLLKMAPPVDKFTFVTIEETTPAARPLLQRNLGNSYHRAEESTVDLSYVSMATYMFPF